MSTSTDTSTRTRPAERPAPRRPQRSSGDRAFANVDHAVLILWSLVVILPLLWTIYSSFKTSSEILLSPFAPPSELNFDNFVTAWTEAGIGRFFFNTVIVVGGALILVMLLGSMCAYVLARFQFPGRQLIYYGMIAGLTFPIFLAVVPLFFVLDNMGLRGTYLGLILTFVGFALPFTVFFLYAFFRQLPDELSEAAAIDGAGPWRTFWRVVMPNAYGISAAVGTIVFIGSWNSFLWPLLIGQDKLYRPVQVSLSQFMTSQRVDLPQLFIGAAVAILPALLIFVFLQRYLVQGVEQSGID